jgi:tRNA modification GTPase
MIEKTLESAGFVSIAWQDWAASRADDSISSAARVALADARTERTAAVLLDQYNGALRLAMNKIQQTIAGGDVAAACRIQNAILARADFGRHLTRPWRVTLAGRPNVGKSSLLNALAGCSRAIVYSTPGTTRDAVSFQTAIDGLPVELCDTAGLRAATDAIERAGVALARERAANADLVLFVSDWSEPWSDEDQALADAWPEAVVVHNKSDVQAASAHRPKGVLTSAIRGEGIDRLLTAISSRLVPDPPPAGAAVPINEEQVKMVRNLATKS